MRLHLVSLALLLALCRPSSSSEHVPIFLSTTATETKTMISAATKAKEVKKIAPKLDDATTVVKMDEFLGNTLYAMILDGIKEGGQSKFETLPTFYKKALTNGVLCEMEKKDIDTKIITNLYGATDGKMTAQLHTDEKSFVGNKIVCTPPVGIAAICWCAVAATDDQRKSVLYCLAKEFADKIAVGFTKGPLCLEEALKNLESVAPTYGGVDPTDANPNAATTTDVPTTGVKAKLLCDAAEKAEEAIKKVYAADATLWTLDAIISTGVDVALSKQYGMNDGKDVEASCKEEPLKSSPVGKCVCPLDKGFLLFCYPHLMGKKLQEIGYLDCAANPPAFQDDKKPSTLPDILVPVKTNDVTKTPGNATEPSSAATSSLLLAAAVVLLGQ